MKLRKLLPMLLISYVIVLGINVIGNYRYYAAGNDWHYSVFFCIGMTTLCWAWFLLLYVLVFKRLKWFNRPTLRIIVMAFIFAIAGAAIVLVGMKAMVLLLHWQEQPTYDYVNNAIYSALFSMVTGLMITAQQTLIHLKKNVEDTERMKQEMIQSQYETLKNQVNPHFLFNSLNTLTVMIPRQPDVAVSYVEQMSKVFRYSLQHSNENTIDVATELKVVQSYLFLNAQRFDGKLITEIQIDEQAQHKKIITQSLLMLVENAIKHNEISHERPLSIHVYNNGGYLVVENTLQRRALIEKSTNVGLENIKKRYELASAQPVVIEERNNHFTVKIPLLP